MQSIGERLEEARKRKGISIREAAEATKIRGEYLHKYEGNQFDISLPEIYVRGFLRTYANYLKLPADKIISDYNALGLNDPKLGKGLNREVYGRMDLSVAKAKPEKDPKDPAAQAGDPSAPSEAVARNPATFVPRPATPLRLDRNMLLKGGVFAVIGILAVALILWLISGRHAEKSARSETTAEGQVNVWTQPVGDEKRFTLVAQGGRVQLTVTLNDGTPLFRGIIPAGETRDLPRKGMPINIHTDSPENLKMRFEGPTLWPMPADQRTGLLAHSAVVDAAK